LSIYREAGSIHGTGAGKSHLAIAIAPSCIRTGSSGRFFTTVDRVKAKARIKGFGTDALGGSAKVELVGMGGQPP